MPGIRQGSNHTPDGAGAAGAAFEAAVNGTRQSGRFPPWRPRVGAVGSRLPTGACGRGSGTPGLCLWVCEWQCIWEECVCVCAGCGWGARGSQLPDWRLARPYAAPWYQRAHKGRTWPLQTPGPPRSTDWAGLRSRPLISQKMRFCMLHGFLKIEHPKIETHNTTISAASPRFEWYLGLLCESYSTGFHQVKYVFCVPPSGAGWNH